LIWENTTAVNNWSKEKCNYRVRRRSFVFVLCSN